MSMQREKGKNGLYVCPCCGYATLGSWGDYEICKICYWEDDDQDDPKADENWGGTNPVSLTEGRINFLTFGASVEHDLENVRPPTPQDENVRNYRLEDGKVVIGRSA